MLEMSSSMSQSSSTESTMFYFLELYGETSPEVDIEYAEVLATRGKSNAGPIYEYLWTLGRVEHISSSSRSLPRKSPSFPAKAAPVPTGASCPVAVSRRCTCCSRGTVIGACRSLPFL